MTGTGTRSLSTRAGSAGRRRRLRATVAGVMLAAVAAGSAQAATCSPSMDRLPFQFRALQSRLMVAALTCDVRTQYNDFVVRFQSALARNGRALDGTFRRIYGAAAERQLNRFITELANDDSIASIGDRARFCADAQATFVKLAAMREDEVDAFTRERYASVKIEEKVCTASRS